MCEGVGVGVGELARGRVGEGVSATVEVSVCAGIGVTGGKSDGDGEISELGDCGMVGVGTGVKV